MFGRRRRVAPVIPAPTPAPELSDERVHELLRGQLDELIGAQGSWTLVPRSHDDTDVIFHSLKAREIASVLAEILRAGKADLRGEAEPDPSALSWTPAPISTWAEPDSDVAPVALHATTDAASARLVA